MSGSKVTIRFGRIGTAGMDRLQYSGFHETGEGEDGHTDMTDMTDDDPTAKEEYTRSAPFQGKPADALAAVKTILMGQNFRITQSTDDELIGEGEGMTHNKEHPLRGATRIRVRVQGSHLSVSAVLGGANRMKKFVIFFPPGLCLFLGLGSMFSGQGMTGLWICLGIAAPWFILGPLMGSMIVKKTVGALDILLHNVTSAAS